MTDTKQKEIWRTYPDYPFIEVSNLGKVRTKDRYVRNGKNRKRLVRGVVLKQQLKKSGYMQVQVRANGRQVFLRVNRMVAICFIQNPNNYPEVNHIDNDRTNNAVSNLEWCTHQYNQDYRKNFGTSASELFGMPVIAVNMDTFEVFWFESQHEAARQLDVNQGNICNVLKGKVNKTGGYWFCDADENTVEKVRAKFGDEVAKKVEELISKNS